MSANKALVRWLHEIWSTGDLAAVDKVYAAGFVAHFPPSSRLPERPGLEAVRQGIIGIRTSFPDWREEVEDLVEEGDRVVSRYTSSGTHRGDFWGLAPTGRRVTVPEVSIYRIEHGQVVEQWCMLDELARLQQLGARLRRPGE